MVQRLRILFAAAPFLAAFVAFAAQAQVLPHHELRVALQPDQHILIASDTLILPEGTREIEFTLHRGLHPASPDATLEVQGSDGWLQQYRVVLPAGSRRFTLNYRGEIYQPPQQEKREARTFETTPGVISAEGVFLSANSGWYPQLPGMTTFSLTVETPAGWRAVSQGAYQEGRWQETQPQDEIYLIAAPYTEYAADAGGIAALVYLRQDDTALAQRYLDATRRYLALYQNLLGPYPYAKFALVENFWETGYGMPSFTLLGSQVIRLPFIADTSYPHEILHNWWGNGVYVDYERGNWSEGLTAYLADHLLQEQKGQGADHRRGTLQKYADFINAERDFPLAEFSSRHSMATEAVGYGKALMLFHMLRRELGDAIFVQALRAFYRDQLFKRAGYAELEAAFSKTSGRDLHNFFAQWVEREGAPQLQLEQPRARRTAQGYELSFTLTQSQSGSTYALSVPIAVTLAGAETAYQTTVTMQDKQTKVRITVPGQPLRLDIDPEFDLFRRLARAEIPPAFSQLFGAERLTIVLPTSASADLRTQYQAIAQTWQQQPGRRTRIKWDNEIDALPQDSAVWLFGWENAFLAEMLGALPDGTLQEHGVHLDDEEYPRDGHAYALSAGRDGQTIAWLAADSPAALPTLARKLPHYAKFGYAAFAGDQVSNLAKGSWEATRSPLAQAVVQEDGNSMDVPRARLSTRSALAAP